MGVYQILGANIGFVPPEWVALGNSAEGSEEDGNPLTKWQNVIGTGPWILSDFVSGASMIFDRNPDYWGYDERYPENQLPYADTYKILAITDTATALAAIRSGQVDIATDPLGALSWQQGRTLEESNPEINVVYAHKPAAIINLRVDTAPFDNILVRKAMQLAVDRTSIGESYFGGTSEGNPVGLISPAIKGWAAAYEDWPADLQAEYAYDPEKARELLAEAGYPEGFSTNVVAMSVQDLQLLTVIKSEFMEIGIDMEIVPLDPPTYNAYLAAGKHDQMAYSDGQAGKLSSPSSTLAMRVSSSIPATNNTFNYDTTYDALVTKIENALTEEEARTLTLEADEYILRQHWSVTVVNSGMPVIWQSYVKGYSAENQSMSHWVGALRARLWIDQE
jgi:peptide/nickel transport system substrate-binding protein